jgi:flagellin
VQSQSGSITNNERKFLNQEYSQLNTQIDDIAGQTKFNGAQLLNGAAGKTLSVSTSGAFAKFEGDGDLNTNFRGITLNLNEAATGTASLAYVGADAATGTHATDATIGTFTLTYGNVTDTIQMEFATDQRVVDGELNFKNAGMSVSLANFDFSASMAAESYTVGGSGDLTFQVGAASADTVTVNIDSMTTASLAAGNAVDGAISQVNGSRAELGAMMSRFEFSAANLATTIENLDAARSTLMDVDMATEMTKFTSNNVLTQASVSMLAQANQMPQTMLQLLR